VNTTPELMARHGPLPCEVQDTLPRPRLLPFLPAEAQDLCSSGFSTFASRISNGPRVSLRLKEVAHAE
jgi:hypothetical protein